MSRVPHRGCVFITCILLIGLAAPARGQAVSVGSVEAASGDETAVPILLKQAVSVGAMHLELRYDPSQVEFASVAKRPLLSGNSMLDSTVSPGRLVVGIVSLDAINGDGALAEVRFRVKAAEGVTSSLRLEGLRAWDNKSHAELLVTAQDGQVKVVGSGAPAGLRNLGPYAPWLIAGTAVLLLLIVLVARGRKPRGSDIQAPTPGARR